MIKYNYVIDKTTGRLISCGYSNFDIDESTEEILDFHEFIPLRLDEYYYKWDGEKFIEDGEIVDEE